MPTEEIIVLANSLKMRGRCIAGVSTHSGKWVRPVSEWAHGELYPSDFGMSGEEPKPLDIVRFSYSHPVPEPAQPENVLLESEPWELVDRIESDAARLRLDPFLSAGPDLLGNRGAGVSEDMANAGMLASLTLVRPEELSFEVRPNFAARAVFGLSAQPYDLPLTDWMWKPRLRRRGPGVYEPVEVGLPTDVLLTVSLGQSFNGTNWKLAAGCVPTG